MNTPEPAKTKALIVYDEPPAGLMVQPQVARKLTKRQQKWRKRSLLKRSPMVGCQKCRQGGGTMVRLPHKTKEGGALYIHRICP